MKDTKFFSFDILKIFNKFKFYCFIGGTSSNYLIDIVRMLNREQRTLTDVESDNLIHIYCNFPYKFEFIFELLKENLLILINGLQDDIVISRLILNCLNYKQRKYRLSNRIENILGSKAEGDHVYFFTLTFKEEVYAKWSQSTRHKRIQEWLLSIDTYNKKNSQYICNVDIGSKNKRVHYHGILLTTLLNDELQSLYDYGFSFFQEIISVSENSNKILASYINKLVNHTYKDGTLQENVIFSRKRRKRI